MLANRKLDGKKVGSRSLIVEPFRYRCSDSRYHRSFASPKLNLKDHLSKYNVPHTVYQYLCNESITTDELITFFIDKDVKFVDSPDNFQEVITSYNNGTYCMSELNKVFLEHSKQYKINDTEVYNKRHILKVLKDIKK